mgnify:FL=1
MSLKLNNKSAILFDMDGVLYNSMPNHAKAWSETMAFYGMNMPPMEVYMHEGCTGSYTVNQVSLRERGYGATEEEVKEIYAHKAELFRNMPMAEIMPGAMEVFKRAKAAGLKIHIVTGSGQKTLIERVVKDFEGYITREKMVTSFDVKRGKPFPDPYLKGLELAGVDASQAVVVENAPMGVRAAVAAGIETIAVNTGPLDDAVLLNEGASILFSSMQELADKWETLF